MYNVSEAMRDGVSRALFAGRKEFMPADVSEDLDDENITGVNGHETAMGETELQGTNLR